MTDSKKWGGAPIGPDVARMIRLEIRLSEDERASLDALASVTGLSMAAVLRTAIRMAWTESPEKFYERAMKVGALPKKGSTT